MGVTLSLASIAIGAGIALGAGILIYGIYYGVSYIFRKTENGHEIEAEGKGNELVNAGNQMVKDFKKNNIEIDKEDENELQKEFKKMGKDKINRYKVNFNISKISNIVYHENDEVNNLEKLNKRFNKSYTYKENYINLSNNGVKFGNDYINIFSKINWEGIIELNLTKNNISLIEPLFNVCLFKLEKLDLSSNLIKDIDKFSDIKIAQLKEIYLTNNKIENPFSFQHVKFKYLEYLDISNNKIENTVKKIFRESYQKFNINGKLIL